MTEKKFVQFSDEQRKAFVGSIKTGKKKREAILENGMSLEEAFVYAYLDVSRVPLQGIGKCVGDPIKVRKQCISDEIRPFCEKELASVQDEYEFDCAHEKLSEIIREFYRRHHYDRFTVGKTQNGSTWHSNMPVSTTRKMQKCWAMFSAIAMFLLTGMLPIRSSLNLAWYCRNTTVSKCQNALLLMQPNATIPGAKLTIMMLT